MRLFFLFLATILLGCDGFSQRETAAVKSDAAAPDADARSTPRAAHQTGPLRVEPLDPNEKPPVFVLKGRSIGPGRLVFLHGMCGHGLGYAQSFQGSAAKRGTLIAPQADVTCGDGPGAKWSMDVRALDQRIVEAFRRLGHSEPIDDICVMGMSQGATRAAALAQMFPERYTRLVSMGAPTAVKTAGLGKLRAAVMMVGERERRDLMLESERALRAKGVPATSLVIEGAEHASMGAHPEKTMDAALEWLWMNSKPIERESDTSDVQSGPGASSAPSK